SRSSSPPTASACPCPRLPTPTEAKALKTLDHLLADCLGIGPATGIHANPDFTWHVPRTASAALEARVPACLTQARQKQLQTYVAPPARLILASPRSEGTAARGFTLSPGSTARIAGAAALVLALTVGVSVLAATRLVRPLRALTGAAQRMRDGDDDARAVVRVRGDDEIGRLAAAFNEMSEQRARLAGQRRAMVGDVAHELRTPLSNIRGWLEAAQDGVAAPDGEFIASLHEEAVLLQHVIDDLQDLAAADAGELRVHPEPVGAADLLGQVAAAHRARAEAAGVTVTTDVPPGHRLTADPVRLRQAVGNLVSNAVRHTPPGGAVRVTCRPGPAGDSVIEVADSGTGIPAEDLPHVFDRFWRAEKSRSRRTGGSGLGLAIVRKLAEAHGGTVDVRSAVGQGTVFTLRLPPEHPAEDGATTGSGAGGARPAI
ncbi:sensor histidine kinase, partial [Streptomyces sp. NPDC057654]|uniref:sensor histidine kinase n=1 Tax=Streptomyces sp. NPDC057654 TaxID=3346196 RepID=UPI0036863148